MGNPKGHSFSRIDRHIKCPRQHFYDNLYGKFVETPAQKKGSQVHDLYERAAVAMTAHQGRTPLDARAALECALVAQNHGPLNDKKLKDYADRMLPVFEHLHPMLGQNGEPRVEEWFREAAGMKLRGKIDLISKWTPTWDNYGRVSGHKENMCVIDYKTTSNPNSIKTAAQARKSPQLWIYCLATGVRNAGFIYIMPSGEPRGSFVTFTESEIARAARWLSGTIASIDRQWEAAEVSQETPDCHDGVNLDATIFSLAEPGHPLCSEKWCSFWDRCLGSKGPA